MKTRSSLLWWNIQFLDTFSLEEFIAHYTLVAKEKKIKPAGVNGEYQPDVFPGSLVKNNHKICLSKGNTINNDITKNEMSER